MKTTITFLRSCALLCILFIYQSANAESNAAFALICPPDQYANCTDEIWDLSIYGDAYVHSYGGPTSAGTPTVVWDLNGCDIGTIYRTWSVTDYGGYVHTCTQEIHVSGVGGGFTEDDITWPSHYELEGCYPNTDPSSFPPGFAYPSYPSVECSSVGVNYQDKTFIINSTCKKLRRTWTIIDWCQYDKSGGGPGYYTFHQDIKIIQSDVPDISSCPEEIIGKTHNCVEGEIVAPAIVIPPNSCGEDFTITNNSPFALSNGADLSGIYPLGTTTVKFTISYGCNEKKFCYVDVIVDDTSAPVPYCYAKIHTALMPLDTNSDGLIDEGMIEIWAKDFDRDSYSPCEFDITPSFSADSIVMFKTFTCADVGDNVFNVYYHSSNGNISYCTVTLDVQNNSDIPNCEAQTGNDTETTRIGGSILDAFDMPLEDVKVECLHSYVDTTYIHEIDTTTTYVIIDSFINQSGVLVYHTDKIVEINEVHDTLYTEYRDIQNLLSDERGDFLFDSVSMHKNYEIFCSQEDLNLDLIDKCDLYMIIDHVMGEVIIEDKEMLFAADVDENGAVDFDDIKYMIFYLTGTIDELPYSKPYYIFPKESESYNYENNNSIFINDLDEELLHTDFTYIMKGNLCEYSNNSQTLLNDEMNILASLTEKLPLSFRNDIESEVKASFSEAAEFVLYPNPFVESFILSVKNPKAQIIKVEVFDANGKSVYRRSSFMDKGNQMMDHDLSPYPSGLYFYQVNLGDTEFHGKVIKK